MNTRAELAAICTAVLTCSSCSLVVGELELHCTKPSDCDALNEEHGIDPEKDCFIYQCRSDERGCEKRAKDLDNDKAFAPACDGIVAGPIDCDDENNAAAPDQGEQCDGSDNDCNGFIDDGLFGESPLISEPVEDRELVHLSHGYSAARGLLVALTNRDNDRRSTALWKLSAGSETQHGSAQLVHLGSVASDDPTARNCSEPMGASYCKFESVVLGVHDELVLGLGINTAGCRDGQLRVGVDGSATAFAGAAPRIGSTREQAIDFAWDDRILARRASAAAKGLVVGVDRSSDSNCSLSSGQQGASSPGLAVLPNGPTGWQSLSLWRAGPANSRAPLVGLALWLDDGLIANASGDGHAEVVDARPGLDPPTARAWAGARDQGHFIAYDTDRTIELAFIPALDDASQPVVHDMRRGRISAQSGARHPILALQEQTVAGDVPRGLALSWREGSADQTTIRFAEISFNPRADGDAFLVKEPIVVSGPRPVVEGPVIVHVPSGVVPPATAPANRDGGWFVMWLEEYGSRRSIVGVRVAEATGSRIEAPFPIFQSAEIEHLFAYSSESSVVRYGFVTGETGADGGRLMTLNIGSLSCRDP